MSSVGTEYHDYTRDYELKERIPVPHENLLVRSSAAKVMFVCLTAPPPCT